MTKAQSSMAAVDDGQGLAHRIRAALGPDRMVREVRMFGGLCFMVKEKMVVGVMKGGELLVRADPNHSDYLLAVEGARQAEMGEGRSMGRSWISVSAESIATDASLGFWVTEALTHNTQITAS